MNNEIAKHHHESKISERAGVDDAIAFYNSERMEYGDDFSREGAIEDIHRMYGAAVARQVEMITNPQHKG